jgi:protein arginine kinase activator
MKCSHCHENEANTHIKKTINGKTEEMYLCSECAKELGVMEEFEPFSMDSLFGNFLGAGAAALNSLAGIDRCGYCGSSFNDIVKSGKVGCANCYEKFEDKLSPSIEKIHGRTKHVGKNVTYTVEQEEKSEPVSEVEQLKLQLKDAIKEQRFEDAAVLRDKIKDMTQGE